jgi:hypothetical protein
MRIDIEIFAPLDHALEDADEALEALGSNPSKLIGRRTDLESLTAARDFGDDVDETLEDVGRRKVAVVVHVNVDNHLLENNQLTIYFSLALHSSNIIANDKITKKLSNFLISKTINF